MLKVAPSPDLAPIADEMLGSKVGPYVLLRRIGQGGMGVVYEARHEHIGQRAAAKILMRELARDSRVLQRFLDEAKAMTLVQHEGIVKVFDYGQLSDGVPYILMEYLEGQSLQHRLNSATTAGSGLPIPSALEIARQVASAISALHQKNIVHRDLKPDNLFLIADSLVMGGERVKLLDFGLAKVMNQQVRRTTDGSILGTPLYMSPEQWEGGRRLSAKSDVYSLGAMLFELLCGRPPFVEETPAQLMYRHVNTEAPLLSELAEDVPSRLDGILALMLAKAPAARPDMVEVQSLLMPMCLEFAGRGSLQCRQGVIVPTGTSLSDGMSETLGAEPRALHAPTLQAVASTPAPQPGPRTTPAGASSQSLAPVSGPSGPMTPVPLAADASALTPAKRSSSSQNAIPVRSLSKDALIIEPPTVAARSTSLSELSVSLPQPPPSRKQRWLFVGAGLVGLLLLTVAALVLVGGRSQNHAAVRPPSADVATSHSPPTPPVASPAADAKPVSPAVPAPVVAPDPAVAESVPQPENKPSDKKGKRRLIQKKQRAATSGGDDPMTVFREH